MKAITAEQFNDVLEDIISDREKLAKLKREDFVGVTYEELSNEIRKRLGDSWMVKKSPPFKLKDFDIPTIANARYFKGIGVDGQKIKGYSGQMLLMAWALVILALAILTLRLSFIPEVAYVVLGFITTVGFMYLYSKGQRAMTLELNRTIRGSNKVETD